MNFKEWLLSEESIEQNFDKWIEDIKNHAGPKESEIISMKNWIDDKNIQFIKNTLKKKNQENKQYLKYLIGFANTPQASFQEDYERAIDTIQWFITTNKMTKRQIEEQGWFNVGKQANELIKQKNQIVNKVSATQAKKERKAGKSDDLPIVAQSGNIKIYLSEKVLQNNEIEELTNSNKLTKHPAIVARHAFLCRYGRNTEWCTASPDGDYHADYGDRDVYIVHINDKPEYQFMGCTRSDPNDNCQFHDSGNLEAKKIPSDLAKLIMDKLPDIAKYYKVVFYNAHADKINAIETVDDILNFFNVEKLYNIPDDDISIFISCLTDKDKIAELIVKNMPNLTNQNIENLLINATNKDKIAEAIVEYKYELTNSNIVNLLYSVTVSDNIAELIINKKQNLSQTLVSLFLKKATYKDEIAKLIGAYYITNLDDQSVDDLIYFATEEEKNKFAQIINKYHTKKTPEIQEIIDQTIEGKYE